jgi:hypothetical protein
MYGKTFIWRPKGEQRPNEFKPSSRPRNWILILVVETKFKLLLNDVRAFVMCGSKTVIQLRKWFATPTGTITRATEKWVVSYAWLFVRS